MIFFVEYMDIQNHKTDIAHFFYDIWLGARELLFNQWGCVFFSHGALANAPCRFDPIFCDISRHIHEISIFLICDIILQNMLNHDISIYILLSISGYHTTEIEASNPWGYTTILVR